LESPRKWRQAHPDYWKQYRQSHPQQVERNRRQQRLRDQKRQLNLANNNLAARKPLSFQPSSHPNRVFQLLANNIPLARRFCLPYKARHALRILRLALAD
jgi:hypothetical protein